MMTPIEIRVVWDLPGGGQMVQTGIYVFSTTKLQEVYDLLAQYKDNTEGRRPDHVEFSMRDFEEEEE